MDVNLFDFDLPETQIALRPKNPREQAKLLHVGAQGQLCDYHIADLVHLIQPTDALVFNDTKVIASALCGQRQRPDAPALSIHINLHQRISLKSWRAFARPARRLRLGDKIIFTHPSQESFSRNGVRFLNGKHGKIQGLECFAERAQPKTALTLTATLIAKYEGGEIELVFDKSGDDLDRAISSIGQMPLPPYIASKRVQDGQDEQDYQTIFAREAGAVAAPTAGLHFTQNLLDALKMRGIEIHFVTLHVGAGTFLPVKVEDTKDHKMHHEIGHIDAMTAHNLNKVKARGGRIIAVGTTALRLLESATNSQNSLAPWSGATDIFITPGYKFRLCDRLLTNFHLPRSTLFMLVSAFSGLNNMQRAYSHAIAHNYRFYSYGDACLLDLNKEEFYE